MLKPMSCGTVLCLLISMASLIDATVVPILDWSDECGVIPLDDVVLIVCMLDDGSLVYFSSPSMDLVFLESCWKVSASLSNVYFATFTGNAVNTGSAGSVLSVLGCVYLCV